MFVCLWGRPSCVPKEMAAAMFAAMNTGTLFCLCGLLGKRVEVLRRVAFEGALVVGWWRSVLDGRDHCLG